MARRKDSFVMTGSDPRIKGRRAGIGAVPQSGVYAFDDASEAQKHRVAPGVHGHGLNRETSGLPDHKVGQRYMPQEKDLLCKIPASLLGKSSFLIFYRRRGRKIFLLQNC